MKNKGIVVLLIVLTVVIAGIIVTDFFSDRPDRRPANPYELNTDSIIATDPRMIIYKEVRDLKLNMEQPTGISRVGEKLAVTGDRKLIILGINGKLDREVPLAVDPLCVKATPGRFYIGTYKQVIVLDSVGVSTAVWNNLYENSVITSIDVYNNEIFIADAGKRLVYRFNREGKKELEFEGKSEKGDEHGFIVPSSNFDLAIDPSGDFWVANPGKFALENYTFEGKLRGWWDAPGDDIQGFSGCCNPANFTFLPDGNFITSEKGVVRVKEYRPSGEFAGVVAAPSLFQGEKSSPDVVTDDQGRVYVLDKERKMIRIFEKNRQWKEGVS